MDYEKLGNSVVTLVGGAKNVKYLTNCATRLRFVLFDEDLVDEAKLKKVSGVLGSIKSGGQYQVIIGNEVSNVYKAIMKSNNFKFDDAKSDTPKSTKKQTFLTKALDYISGSFTPALAGVTGAGMIKALLALLSAFGWIDTTGMTYKVLEVMSDAAFYYLPIFLAYSAAQKLRCNPYISMVIAGILLHPNLSAMFAAGPVSFLGLPIKSVAYASSVIPVLLMVLLLSYVEPFIDKITPTAIKFFLKPLLIILIVAPVTLIVLGPIGGFIGDVLAGIMEAASVKYSWLVVGIMGAFSPLLVMTGMHYSLMPVSMTSYARLGYENFMLPGMLAANIAQGGATLGVSFKTKDKELKSIASSTGITAVLGITEPAMYGVNLKYKKPFIAVMIGGALGGFFAGIAGVKAYAIASPGLAALPIFLGDTFIAAVITVVISFCASFAISYLTWNDNLIEKD